MYLILSNYTRQQTLEYKSILSSLNMLVWIWSVIIIEASLGAASTFYMGLYPAAVVYTAADNNHADGPDIETGSKRVLAF